MKEVSENRTPKGQKHPRSKNGRNGEPVSLYPLTPEEAMRALLKVPPEPKENKQAEPARKRK
jgi:hypothetical protein